jgi:hypothetical protein
MKTPADTNAKPLSSSNWKRDGVVLAVLVLLHELCRRALADGVIVSSLFAPLGIKTALTLASALVFLVIRLTLYVGVPGWLGARLVLTAAGYLERRRR